MTGYFAEAGVVVPDVLTAPSVEPPGPAELRALAERYGIRFWVPSVGG